MKSSVSLFRIKRKSSIALVKKFYQEIETIKKADNIDSWKRHGLEKLQNEVAGLLLELGDINYKLALMIDDIRFGIIDKRISENDKKLSEIERECAAIKKEIKSVEAQLEKTINKKDGPKLTLVKKCSNNIEGIN